MQLCTKIGSIRNEPVVVSRKERNSTNRYSFLKDRIKSKCSFKTHLQAFLSPYISVDIRVFVTKFFMSYGIGFYRTFICLTIKQMEISN